MALRKSLRIIGGGTLVTLGVLGLILPIMPGWAFLIPGLLILADYYPPVRRLLRWAREKASAMASRRSQPPAAR